MKLNLPLYNDAGLRALETLTPPLGTPPLGPHDSLMLVSGNVDKPLDLDFLTRAHEPLRRRYPGTPVLVATAGLAHLAALAQANVQAAGLVYIYEPNFANVPEFSWNFEDTLKNLEQAVAVIHRAGLRAVFKPTGRPLLQRALQPHGWHYGTFAERVDALFVQTQTYCQNGTFAEAAEKLAGECSAHLKKTYVQLTLDLAARNGVSPVAARACLAEAERRGFGGVTAWWSPRFSGEAAAFLEMLPRQV